MNALTCPEAHDDGELEDALLDLSVGEQLRRVGCRTGRCVFGRAVPTSHGGGSGGYPEEIEGVASLRDAGTLAEEELASKKRQILGLN